MARFIELLAPTGISLSCELSLLGTDAVAETIVLTERTNAKTQYIGIVTAASGVYVVKYKIGSNYIDSKIIKIKGADTTVSRVEDILTQIMQEDAGVFQFTANALEQAPTGGGGGSLSGPNTVLLTFVDESAVPLENVLVRFSEGVQTETKETNVDGQVTFTVENATWRIRAFKVGYEAVDTTLVVNGDETPVPYEMASVSPSGNPMMAVGQLYCYDENGELIEGIEITAQHMYGPGSPGFGFAGAEFTFESDVNGLASHLFVRGGVYKIHRQEGVEMSISVPDEDVFLLPEVLGYPP